MNISCDSTAIRALVMEMMIQYKKSMNHSMKEQAGSRFTYVTNPKPLELRVTLSFMTTLSVSSPNCT